jgi:mono/diheme cytochrome c family protein
LNTPFGTIFASNITPDPETGIGRWSRDAFVRAMRHGVARDGRHLYPVFPYDHFSRMTDVDLDALYAFLMTRPPVEARMPANRLIWPLGYRPIMAAWNVLYLHQSPARDADRGRYLAEGLAHCGACHTPRDRLGAEMSDRVYDGAWTEGWYAPPLNAHSPAVRPWTADELYTYLRTGFSTTHAAAAGPMAEVVHELAAAPEADVRAIALYFAGLMAKPPGAQTDVPSIDNRSLADQSDPEGAALFAGACAACHEAGAPMMQHGRPPLAWGTSLRQDAPHNVLHVIVGGLTPAAGRAGPAMPAFGDDFTDRQLAEIAAYLRLRYTDLPPWQGLEQAAAKVRQGVGQ